MSLVERVAEAIHPWICADPREGIAGNAHKAANAALMAQGFVTCQTCGGSGKRYAIHDHTVNFDLVKCPNCRGLGVVPSEAMIERAALALHKQLSDPEDWDEVPQVRKREARAALLEAFGGDE